MLGITIGTAEVTEVYKTDEPVSHQTFLNNKQKCNLKHCKRLFQCDDLTHVRLAFPQETTVFGHQAVDNMVT